MNFKQVMIVFRKEFLELLRDKRTLFTTLLLPVILYPVMIIGFNAIMTRQTGVKSRPPRWQSPIAWIMPSAHL